MPKNIVICFDGTKNDPSDADQEILEAGGLEDDGISNILKLYFLLGGRLKNINQVKSEADDDLLDSQFNNQPVFYFQGVGSYGGPIKKLLNSALAPRQLDVRRIIGQGLDVLDEHYKQGDQIFLFGFSRGAAIARRFASVITRPENGLDLAPKAVRFMGVFDTVSSFGMPGLSDDKLPDSDVIFEDKNRVSENVVEALHLVSLDERRNAFKPTLMANEDRITEVWFPGVHSDIGGGYFYDGLSDITLEFMLSVLNRRVPDLKTRSSNDVVAEEFSGDDFGLDEHDIKLYANHLAMIHWHSRIGDVFLGDRDLRVCASKNNAAVNPTPLIHRSALDRIADDHSYMSASLFEGISHRIIDNDGTLSPATDLDFDHHRTIPRIALKSLAVSDTLTVQVHASQHYCPARVAVKAGETYLFKPESGSHWVDQTIKCDAKGWQAKDVISLFKRPFFYMKEGDRRHPDAEWFELLGSVGRSDAACFRPLHHHTDPWTVNEDGELFFFPNDLIDYYGNNKGFIDVTIKRVS